MTVAFAVLAGSVAAFLGLIAPSVAERIRNGKKR